MAKAIIMPQVGQDLKTALLTEWHVKVGDTVKKGDIIATVDSDKASFEVEAFESGIVLELLVPEGKEGEVFQPIAYVGEKGESLHQPDVASNLDLEEPNTEHVSMPVEEGKGALALPFKEKLIASPSARRMVREKQVELSSIAGTGPESRIIKADVLHYLLDYKQVKATPIAKQVAQHEGVSLSEVNGSGPNGRIQKSDVMNSLGKKSIPLKPNQGDEVIYFDKIRKIIADRLTLSKQTIPHYYLFIDVNVTQALAVKVRIKEELGFKVSVNDILIHVVAKALKQFKTLNAHVDQEKIIVKPQVNIGIAVSVANGLLVPALADADQLNLGAIAEQSRKIASDAARGIVNTNIQGTFTISNLGMYGIKRFNAIINPPECGILSVGAIEKKVVPTDRGIEVIDSMELGLAVDHRAVDGALAAQFLGAIKNELEQFKL